jgi:SnoaL-like domain
MSDPTTIVRTYIDMWNETDPGRRRQLVAEALTDDASYLDPIMAGNGTDEISAMIGAAQAQYPGHRFELVAGPDVHHDRVRFTWSLGSPAGEPIARYRLRGDGRGRPDARRHRFPRVRRLADPRAGGRRGYEPAMPSSKRAAVAALAG